MIPRATIVALADEEGLFPTTVDKDYVLGWLLYGIAGHPALSRWVFKGGTCLKKCFFETYRFSEDLDFTVPANEELTEKTIEQALKGACDWVSEESGITFPAGGLEVEAYTNKQGAESFQARLTYVGPYSMKRRSQQRVKLDITQQEILVEPAEHRKIFHRYEDALEPAPTIACYSVHEILAEKTRALYERQGRARDVYDVVHISRNFRDQISPTLATKVAVEKFKFKGLEMPTADGIVETIDLDVLEANWEQQLRHQLPRLPDLQGFRNELMESLIWWMEPERATPPLPSAPVAASERVLPRVHFPRRRLAAVGGPGAHLPDPIRFAARNRLLARFGYHGVARLVEPYSLRVRGARNVFLCAFERSSGDRQSEQLESYEVGEIVSSEVLDIPFRPRWAVELSAHRRPFPPRPRQQEPGDPEDAESTRGRA